MKMMNIKKKMVNQKVYYQENIQYLQIFQEAMAFSSKINSTNWKGQLPLLDKTLKNSKKIYYFLVRNLFHK